MLRTVLTIAALPVALTALGAAAQTTTNCVTNGNTTRCYAPAPVDQTIALRVRTPTIEPPARQPAKPPRADQEYQGYAQARAEVKEAVIANLRSGNCKNAEDLALLSGDIGLATQVRQYCAVPKP